MSFEWCNAYEGADRSVALSHVLYEAEEAPSFAYDLELRDATVDAASND